MSSVGRNIGVQCPCLVRSFAPFLRGVNPCFGHRQQCRVAKVRGRSTTWTRSLWAVRLCSPQHEGERKPKDASPRGRQVRPSRDEYLRAAFKKVTRSIEARGIAPRVRYVLCMIQQLGTSCCHWVARLAVICHNWSTLTSLLTAPGVQVA